MDKSVVQAHGVLQEKLFDTLALTSRASYSKAIEANNFNSDNQATVGQKIKKSPDQKTREINKSISRKNFFEYFP